MSTEATSVGRVSGAFGQAAPSGPPSLRTRVVEALLAIVRDPNPILLKELRATLRTPLYVRFLYLATGLVSMVVLMASATVSEGNAAPAEVGRAIFHIFFSTIALVLVFAAPSQAASAMTLEKETKTWESLLLSGMSPTRIVLGKFFAVYGSIVLVVIAVAPVIGVGFLFGGVSPLAVLLAFAWLLGAVAVAVAFGIAVSVRMESTRASVSATSVLFIPLCLIWASIVVALGDPAHDAWGTPYDGPIWFGPAFAERYDALDAWLLLVVLPAYFFSMLTWLNLAGAIAGVNAPGVDRSTGLKLWSLYAALGTAITVIGTVFMATDADDAGEVGLVFGAVAVCTVFPLIALVFANEPPLPPRIGAPKAGPRRWTWDLIGPGAGPTLRFAFAVLVLGIGGMVAGTVAVRHVRWPVATLHGMDVHRLNDIGALVLFSAGLSVLVAVAATSAWLRSLLRNGAAARALTITLFVGAVLASLVIASAIEPRSIDRMNFELSPVIGLSPIGPLIIALRFVNGVPPSDPEMGTAGAACLAYGLLAFALWIVVELRASNVAVLVDDHRKRLLAKLGPVESRAATLEAAQGAAIASAASKPAGVAIASEPAASEPAASEPAASEPAASEPEPPSSEPDA